MNQQTVASAIDAPTAATEAGSLFAKSEIEAKEALEIFARAVGTAPTYETWITERTNWVNGYIEVKPNAKGEAADKAFSRFKDRLTDSYGITAPKSTNAAAEKKAAEREKKTAEIMAKHEKQTPTMLRAQLEAAYATLAKNPESKAANSVVKELRQVLKVKQSAENKAQGEELKTLRGAVKVEAGKCTDLDLLQSILDMLVEAIPTDEL
jgi:hypothetical protein